MSDMPCTFPAHPANLPRSWHRIADWLVISATLLVASATLHAVPPAASTTTLAITSAGSPVTTVASPTAETLTASVTSSGSQVTRGIISFCFSNQSACIAGAIIGTAQITSAGTASIRFQPAIGTHTITAVFSGTASIAASSATPVTLTSTQSVALNIQ